MKLSVEKAVSLTSGIKDKKWKVADSVPKLEAVISAKYLEKTIQVKGPTEEGSP